VFLGWTRKNVQRTLDYIIERYRTTETPDPQHVDVYVLRYGWRYGWYPEKIWYLKDPQEGIWLNLDWQAPYPGGPFWADREEIEVIADVIF